MDRAQLQPAWVLHSRRYGDTSLLVELFVRAQGRVGCVAKGALRPGRGAAPLQAFQGLLVEIRGRGEVQTLTRVEPGGVVHALKGRRLYCGMYVNELLLRLTPRQDPNTALFDHYQVALAELAGETALEPLLRRFEVRLLDALGVGLALDRDIAGQPIDPTRRYTYDLSSGAAAVAGAPGDSIAGATLKALGSGEFTDDDCLSEARALMRRVLDHHLDGRPLRSRELFR